MPSTLVFPPEYETLANARERDNDIRRITALIARGDEQAVEVDFVGQPAAPDAETAVQLRLYYLGAPLTLSRLLPILHNLGFEVIDERPYVVTLDDRTPVHLSVVGMRAPLSHRLADPSCEARVVDAFGAVWTGAAEDDPLNRLVLNADLTWRDAAVLRAYHRYLRQVGNRFEVGYVADVLEQHPALASELIALFHARFDPAHADRDAEARHHATIDEQLRDVASLEHDTILRTLAATIDATVRTNFFAPDRAALAFKLDPAKVPLMPLPRPQHEIWVYSPRVEGVHLRAGDIARGGIRWSDRLDDFRTEILQLMKAQVAKNAVIVPTGAKGGFVCRRATDRDEVVACYETFIGGLLDVTDNRVSGQVVSPDHTICHDTEDPYLVVAADKGTARFSDNANRIAESRRFWLGDAFASGGSAGYDHKEMGITARGAWCSIRRHFDELAIALDQPFTVIGIGDMSGDVFGNGLLQSDQIKLIAAFDHRHVFLDPDPDPARSFAERRRLFALPQSSWADYDPALISTGGGVHSRATKAIALTAEVRALLDIDHDSLTPDELIRAILRAPCDLLYNGGIGTYLKAANERHADVGDKLNDTTRVDADEVRARVIGEGGNLGLTARARVAYSRNGGRVFSDAVDNSGGVNTSDHEVNIKILLGGIEPPLPHHERNDLLAALRDEIAEHVLDTNRDIALALTNARLDAPALLQVHADQMVWLEQIAHLDREVEALPDAAEIARRAERGEGLTPPEIAVLFAYTINALVDDVTDEGLLDYPYFQRLLASYFPAPLRVRFAAEIAAHPLRDHLTAMLAVKNLVLRGGLSMAFRLIDETGASTPDLVRAHATAWELFAMGECWADIDSRAEIGADTRTRLRIDGRRLVERATRWLVRNRRLPFAVDETIAALRPKLDRLLAAWPDVVSPDVARAIDATAEHYVQARVPHDIAHRAARQQTFIAALDVIDLATRRGVDEIAAAHTHFAVGDALHLQPIGARIDELPRHDRWQVLARLALREDLHRTHARLTELALADPPGFFADWSARRPRLMARWNDIAGAIMPGPASSEQLSVAVRELRTLLDQLDGDDLPR